MRVVDDALELPGRRERVDDRGIGVLHEGARPRGGAAGGVDERGGRADRVEHREPLGVGDLAVDLAERGREVHDARAVVDGHEVGGDDARPRRRQLEEVERALVVQPDQLVDRDRAEHLGVVAQHVGDARRTHHQVAARRSSDPSTRTYSTSGPTAAPTFDTSVHGVVVHTRRSKSRSTTGKRTYTDGSVTSWYAPGWPSSWLDERGAAPAAVGHDLVALVDVAGVPHLAEEPPDALDVRIVERPVGVVGVEPHADATGEGLEVGDVAVHRLPAQPVELADPERLDLVLVVDPELLLHLHLDREAVAVPTALAGDVVAAHGLEARVEVLEEAGPHVVDPGTAVGGGRTLVEHPLGRAGAAAEALGEHVVDVPAVEGGVLERDEIERGRDGVEGHPGIVPAAAPGPSPD